MPKKAQTPHIYVLAGTNGAGKSSIAGAMLIEEGVEYFNPDQAAELALTPEWAKPIVLRALTS